MNNELMTSTSVTTVLDEAELHYVFHLNLYIFNRFTRTSSPAGYSELKLHPYLALVLYDPYVGGPLSSQSYQMVQSMLHTANGRFDCTNRRLHSKFALVAVFWTLSQGSNLLTSYTDQDLFDELFPARFGHVYFVPNSSIYYPRLEPAMSAIGDKIIDRELIHLTFNCAHLIILEKTECMANGPMYKTSTSWSQ